MKALRSLFGRDRALHLSLGHAVAFACSFLAIPVIAHALGPAGRGETAAALAAFAIVPTIIGMGMPSELRRRSGGALDAPSVRSARDITAMSIVAALPFAALLAWTIYRDVDVSLQIAAFVGVLMTPFTVSWSCDLNTLAARGKYRAVAVIRLCHPFLNLVFIMVLAALSLLTPELAIASHVVASIITAVVSTRLTRVSIRGERASYSALLAAGSTFVGAAFSEAILPRIGQVLALPLLGAVQAGLYSIAASIALLTHAFGESLAADHFRAASVAKTPAEMATVVRRGTQEVVSVALPLCLLFGAGAIVGIPIVFGAAFADAVPAFLWMLPGAFCLVVSYLCSMVLTAQGRGKTLTTLQLCALVVALVAMVVFTPWWGLMGASAALSVSYLFLLIAQAIVLRTPPIALVPTPRAFMTGIRRLLGTLPEEEVAAQAR